MRMREGRFEGGSFEGWGRLQNLTAEAAVATWLAQVERKSGYDA